MTSISNLTEEEIKRLRALVSRKTFEYKYKNHTFKGGELTAEQLADWKKRIDKTCHL